jgi:hypothetical protein
MEGRAAIALAQAGDAVHRLIGPRADPRYPKKGLQRGIRRKLKMRKAVNKMSGEPGKAGKAGEPGKDGMQTESRIAPPCSRDDHGPLYGHKARKEALDRHIARMGIRDPGAIHEAHMSFFLSRGKRVRNAMNYQFEVDFVRWLLDPEHDLNGELQMLTGTRTPGEAVKAALTIKGVRHFVQPVWERFIAEVQSQQPLIAGRTMDPGLRGANESMEVYIPTTLSDAIQMYRLKHQTSYVRHGDARGEWFNQFLVFLKQTTVDDIE